MSDVHDRWDKIEESQNELLNMMQSFCEMERTIPLNETISKIPPSITITPVLPTLEPEDSLIIGMMNIHYPKRIGTKFKSLGVEDHVSNPRVSPADTFASDGECDLSSCDDFSPINIPEGESDVPDDNVKIYSNPLFEFDDEYIFSDVNLLFDEVLEDIESKDSYISKLDESDLLVTPLS
ncbi:hypothetical protein Tco_0856234 [Tanacetum coccineum]